MRKNKYPHFFDDDHYPGLPKILFIGIAHSTHTKAWIELLDTEVFNVRLFSMPGSLPPDNDWPIKIYVSSKYPPEGLNPQTRKCFYLTPEERKNPFNALKMILTEGFEVSPSEDGFIRTLELFLYMFLHIPAWVILKLKKAISNDLEKANDGKYRGSSEDTEEGLALWLEEIIRDWQPDIIHTLGIFDSQGGEFFLKTQKRMEFDLSACWVAQTRGGSDLALNQYSSVKATVLAEVLSRCNYIISDNKENIEIASRLGIPSHKFSPLTPVPGSGGIDTERLFALAQQLPSRRQQIILWPKAYESVWSKALPVIEAFRIVWEHTKLFEVYLLACDSEVSSWISALPDEMRKHFHIMPRIPRDEVFSLMARSRMMIAPSLVDGIPNVLYEAMACGTFPVVSPLKTITPFVKEEENVLFARNLFPEELADAMVRALSNSELVDQAAKNNRRLLKGYADRKDVKDKVRRFYMSIFRKSDSI